MGEEMLKEIIKGQLYQGSLADADSICQSNGRLKDLGLRGILTVADNIRLKAPTSIVHLHLPIDEIHPTPEYYFDIACNLNIFPLLVHCQAGANRSRVFASAIAYQAQEILLAKAIELADPPRSGVVFDSMMKWARS